MLGAQLSHDAPEAPQPAPGPAPAVFVTEPTYQRYLELILQGDRASAGRIVRELLDAGVSVRDLYLDLIQRSMYEVGERWEKNEISVAKEHVATAVTEAMFAIVYPHIFASERCGKRAVVGCVINEYHQVGARMVADILELHGWDTKFVSVGGDVDALLATITEHQPELLGLSLSLLRNMPELVRVLERVTEAFPQLDVIVGGQAFRWGGQDALARFPRVRHVGSIVELEELIRR